MLQEHQQLFYIILAEDYSVSASLFLAKVNNLGEGLFHQNSIKTANVESDNFRCKMYLFPISSLAI